MLSIVFGVLAVFSASPPAALPPIYLSDTPDRTSDSGKSETHQPPPSERSRLLYFSLFPDSGRVRINYRATNLAVHLKPVPEAYRVIRRYSRLRAATPLLFVAGICAIAGTTGYQVYSQKKEGRWNFEAPDFTGAGIGVGLCLSSAVPELFARGNIEDAVAIYNRHVRPVDSEP